MQWAILRGLGDEQRTEVLAAARRRTYRRGEIVFHEGDPGDTLHLIRRGRVAVRITTPLGDTATLRILAPGGWFGELSVLAPAPRSATITALEAVETLTLTGDQLSALRHRHPEIDTALLLALVDEVRRLSSALVDALYVPAPARLVRVLVALGEVYPRAEDGSVTVPLTQDDLAGLCGTTRPTVNQELGRLAERGLIDVARGRVVLRDLTALERRSR